MALIKAHMVANRISFFMLLVILLKAFYLFHHLAENFRTILWRVSILDQANLDIKLELIADDLIVKPICKGRFGVYDFFNLFGKCFTLVIDHDAIYLFVRAVLKVVFVA